MRASTYISEAFGAPPVSVISTDTSAVKRAERIAKLAESLARDAREVGITVSDVRMEAYRKGILTGAERGRTLSFLGTIPLLAGLVKTGRYTRSTLNVTHGNLQMVWVHPDYADAVSPYRN